MANIDLDKEELADIWTALGRQLSKLNMDINEAQSGLEKTKVYPTWWHKWIAEATTRMNQLEKLRQKIHDRIIAIETGRAEEHVT